MKTLMRWIVIVGTVSCGVAHAQSVAGTSFGLSRPSHSRSDFAALSFPAAAAAFAASERQRTALPDTRSRCAAVIAAASTLPFGARPVVSLPRTPSLRIAAMRVLRVR